MARAMWSGVISFGLVSIPVKLYTAVSKQNVKFNQIDSKTNSRVKQKRVNSDGDEVAYDQIVKGYEVAKDSYVILTDEDIASVSPEASRTIDISSFVLDEQIDPIFYDSAYHLVPDELARKPYALLLKAMEDADRVAIAKVVMRTKEYLVALRPRDNMLMMSTMVYSDELVDSLALPGADELQDFEPTKAELAMANQLIDSLAADFVSEDYSDSYRVQLLEMIEKKAAGELQSVTSAEVEQDGEVLDLMAALEASVNAAKEAQKAETKSA